MEANNEPEDNYVEREEDPIEDDANNDEEKQPTNGHKNLGGVDLNYEPKNKITKYDSSLKKSSDLKMNGKFMKDDFIKKMQAEWKSEEGDNFKDPHTSVELFRRPFKIGLLPDLLENPQTIGSHLINEMTNDVTWIRQQMDLYEFYQSSDLSNLTNCEWLSSFLKLLKKNVKPWLEEVTGVKLNSVSASCSMYTCGDYLLVHDDLLSDRQIAFIYYISPWEGTQEWKKEMGGCLEIFNSDDNCFPQFPVYKKISPKNNQLAFFKVGSRSFHQVGEVTNFDYPRLTINGWFHGASNDDKVEDSLRPFIEPIFIGPQELNVDLNELLNPIYLQSNTKRNIQKHIEDVSEISLYDFLDRKIFDEALHQLLNDDSLEWEYKSPANSQYYEILKLDSASKIIAKLRDFFVSREIFKLLQEYTELDMAGVQAKEPTCCLEIQRWSLGNYTILGDCSLCEENTLDLIFYLNATDDVGVINYLAMEDDDAEDGDEPFMLSITPVDNALNIIYRSDSISKFTKYISKNTTLEKGPVFVFSCIYKE